MYPIPKRCPKCKQHSTAVSIGQEADGFTLVGLCLDNGCGYHKSYPLRLISGQPPVTTCVLCGRRGGIYDSHVSPDALIKVRNWTNVRGYWYAVDPRCRVKCAPPRNPPDK